MCSLILLFIHDYRDDQFYRIYDLTHTFYYYSPYHPINRFYGFLYYFFYSFEVRQYSISYYVIITSILLLLLLLLK